MSKVINGVLFGNIDSEELCRFNTSGGCLDKTDPEMEKATYEFLSKNMFPCTINGEDGICINEVKNEEFLKGAFGIKGDVQVIYEDKERLNGDNTLGVTRGNEITVATKRELSALNGTLGHEFFHVSENEGKKQLDLINDQVEQLRNRYTSITDQNEKNKIEEEMIRLYNEEARLKAKLGDLTVKDQTSLSAHNSGKNMDKPYIEGLSVEKATRDVAVDKKLLKPRKVMGKDYCNKQLNRINKRKAEINHQLSITTDPIEIRKLENERKQLFQEKRYWNKQLMGLPQKNETNNNAQEANGNLPHKKSNDQTSGVGATASDGLAELGASNINSNFQGGSYGSGKSGPAVNADYVSLEDLKKVIDREASEFDKIKNDIEKDIKSTSNWWNDRKREEFISYYTNNSKQKIENIIGVLRESSGFISTKKDKVYDYFTLK